MHRPRPHNLQGYALSINRTKNNKGKRELLIDGIGLDDKGLNGGVVAVH